MKKIVSLLLCMLLLCVVGTAFAAEVKIGDEFTVNFSVSNPNGACAFEVKLSYDTSAFEFISSTGASGVTQPGSGSGKFVYYGTTPFAGGSVGSVSFRVKSGAAAKTYAINGVSAGAWDIDDNAVSISVSGGSVTVVKEPCTEHKWVEKVKTEATCTEKGIGYKVCSVCGEKSAEYDIPASGHKAGTAYIQKKATCTENGLRIIPCATCETEISSEVIPATGHKNGEVVITKKATCTENGSQVTKCANCGEVIPDSAKVITALGHNMDKVVTVEATCTTDGSKTYYCTNCGELQKTEVITAKGHTIVTDAAVAATCTKDGLTEGSHCSTCNTVIVKQEKIPAAHTPGKEAVRVEPTCTKDGSISYVCSVCGKKISSEKLPALGHKYDDGVVTTAPTCTKDGVKTYTCQNTGCTKTKTEKVAKLGHKYDDGVVTKAATCTEDGVKTYTCQNDATHTKTEKIKKLGHKYAEGVVTKAPTCTEDGEKTYTCQNDQTHTKTEKVKKLGHKYGEWVITKPVTDTENGEKERTCATCGYVDKQVIPCETYLHMTVCAKGIRFRDYDADITNKWYMFTPIDISVDGEQIFDLVAGNQDVIGTVHVLVQEGTLTVTYELANASIMVKDEFLTILPSIADAANVDTTKLTQYVYGEPISIADDLGGDTKVLLFMLNNVVYEESISHIQEFKDNKEYEAYVEALKLLMD